MHIVDMVSFWARTDPDRPAIIQPEVITSYKGLASAIDSVSNRIAALNLDRAAPIAVAVANPVVLLSILFALLRLGYSASPVNRTLFPHLRSNGIRDLIYDLDGQVSSGGRNIRLDASWLPIDGGKSAQPVPRRAKTDAVVDGGIVFFTSGTTGLPKKFVQTSLGLEQRILHQNMNACVTSQKALVIAGLTTAYGFNATCELLYPGKTVCYSPHAEASLNLIATFGIDAIIASPQQVLSLAGLYEKFPSHDLSSLQAILLGGASISREGAKRIQATLCRKVINKYASTEAGIAALAPMDRLPEIPGAAGFLAPWAEVEIVDEAGTVLSSRSEGFIRYRTPQFLANLVGIEPQAPAGLEKRWFYPGDIGYITEDGVLCIAGRTTDVINRGGFKISAVKIAGIIETLTSVKEAAACGVEGKSGLEEVWVAVVPNGEIDAAKIKTLVANHDEGGVEVDEVFVVDEIPRGDLGKVQKIRLKDMLLKLKRGA